MMLGIIERYVAKEVIKSSLATTLILFVIFTSNTLGRVLSDVSKGNVPLEAVFPVLLGQSVEILTLLMPLGLFLGIVFAFGRLYKDHELVVLQACGFTYAQLYRVLLIVLLPLLALTSYMSMSLSAASLRHAKASVHEGKNIHEIQRLKAGQFNPNQKGDRVFFVQTMSPDKTLISGLAIAELQAQNSMLQTAETGQHDIKQDSGDLFLEVGPGTRYIGNPGQKDYRIIDFETHGMLLQKKATTPDALKSDEKSFTELMQSQIPRDRVELLWRVNVPVVVLVLGLLAIPLSYISPRQGRYGKIGVAILVFVVYLNLMGFSRSGLDSGKIPLWLNFWWVHLCFLALTGILLRKRLGHFLPRRVVRS